ncbi:MAG: hypothetical protein JNL11_03065 [Bdellovibrionaceae bacterium]|nr:hypothetical protein [Pseudobdellovibrionaceae bacterium]
MGAKKMIDVNKVADSKGRISLGDKFSGKQFIVEEKANGEILLKPAVTVPIQEEWLWKNMDAMKKVQTGLGQLNSPKRKSRGSFAKFVKDEK